MNGATHGWPPERVEELRRLYALGLSASDIAAELGCATRNMVIGKINRLGLTRDHHNARPGRPIMDAPKRAIPKIKPKPEPARIKLKSDGTVAPYFAPAPVKVREEPAEAAPLRLTITELRDDSCRWPLGDPSTPEFRYCGADKIDRERPTATGKQGRGSAYCSAHHRLAYEVRA